MCPAYSLEGFNNPSFLEGPAAYRSLVAPYLFRDVFRLSDFYSHDNLFIFSLYFIREFKSVRHQCEVFQLGGNNLFSIASLSSELYLM